MLLIGFTCGLERVVEEVDSLLIGGVEEPSISPLNSRGDQRIDKQREEEKKKKRILEVGDDDDIISRKKKRVFVS